MATEDEYKYIEERLNISLADKPVFVLAACKKYDYPAYTIPKAPPNSERENWTVVRYMGEYYLAE